MKSILSLLIIAFFTLSAAANDQLYMNDFTIKAGKTKTIEMLLDNDTAYCAFQTDLTLPVGLTLLTEDEEYVIDPTDRMTNNHTISSYKLANGAIRVFVTSQSLRTFTGNSGAIATLTIKAASNFSGRLPIHLRGTVAVEPDGTKHTLKDHITWVSDGKTVRGDLNGDGIVDVTDVGIIIDMLLGKTPPVLGRGDINGDGIIDVTDVNKVIDIVLGKE